MATTVCARRCHRRAGTATAERMWPLTSGEFRVNCLPRVIVWAQCGFQDCRAANNTRARYVWAATAVARVAAAPPRRHTHSARAANCLCVCTAAPRINDAFVAVATNLCGKLSLGAQDRCVPHCDVVVVVVACVSVCVRALAVGQLTCASPQVASRARSHDARDLLAAQRGIRARAGCGGVAALP